MAEIESTITNTRERWLPMLQLAASTYHWHLPGHALELLVDDIVPYLRQVEIRGSVACMHIMQHYYQDAPAVRLLCEQSLEATAAWQALILSIQEHIAQDQRSFVPNIIVETRILAKFQAALTEHDYQLPIAQRLAQIVCEELERCLEDDALKSQK